MEQWENFRAPLENRPDVRIREEKLQRDPCKYSVVQWNNSLNILLNQLCHNCIVTFTLSQRKKSIIAEHDTKGHEFD